MDPTAHLELADGPGGWLQAFVRTPTQPLKPQDTVWIRLAPDPAGTWLPTGELYLPGITAETIRKVPLRRIVLAIAANDAIRHRLAGRLDEAVPATGSNEFHSAFNGYPIEESTFSLTRPAGRYLPEDFYEKVAATYRAAVERGLKPRKVIAESAGVSTEVAGRWVRVARSRHLLPETEPGKVRV